jgi:hypothetical protein
LGALLDGRQQENLGAAEPGVAKPEKVGAGVRSLLRGQRTTPFTKTSEPPEEPSKPAIPRWYLFAADILLVALALVLIYKGPGSLNWKGRLFCTVAVALGGCLGLIAVSMKKR